MNRNMKRLCLVFVIGLGALVAEAITVTEIGNFGPTGLEIKVRDDRLVEITGVQVGSPAEGKFDKGQLISTINGHGIPEDGLGPQVHLARRITEAEAADGVLRFNVLAAANVEPEEVVLQIPALGRFSATWPVDCDKTRRIIRNKADAIARLAETANDGLTSHNLNNALAILFLLSTGEEQDLDVVRGIYARRMADFERPHTGSHSWHNGYQGIAVTEYYLRTGDKTVMPLMNAITESARKYQVHGGWTHWAQGVNPQYVAGGLMNPAGTQILTTLLLARIAGAEVDEDTMRSALHYFYRFAGHGANPYGDHRPEKGYGSNNGKSEMLAIAMHVASLASEGGKIYAMARDKNAQTPFYSTRHMLQGHTGGGLGALWHGIAASHMQAQRPELYRHRKDSIQWFYELSRRHDGLFGICGGQRYDQISYGHGMGLALTAPLQTLQITGAPRSPYAKDFSLPAQIWGREADLAFFDIDGGEKYGARELLPEVERATIADLDAAGLERMAYHPEHVYREEAAGAIRDGEQYRLIERLLRSEDPRARQTATLAINDFEPWNMRSSRGIQSRLSIPKEHFTQAMFDALLDMITDPEQALWNVNHALLALPAASEEQIVSRLDDILPWLEHEEWWLVEAGVIALAPAMRDVQAMEARILPAIVKAVSDMEHARPRGTISWFLDRATRGASGEVLTSVSSAYLDIYQQFPSVPDPEEGVDHSGITSVALYGIMSGVLSGDADTVLAGVRASVDRMDDMRPRELNLLIDSLVDAAARLEGDARGEVGKILQQHYRPAVVGDDPAALRERMESGRDVNTMNKLLQIDEMAGLPVGWQLLGNDSEGGQVWWRTSFEPGEELPAGEMNRYRQVELPAHLAGWYTVDYEPSANGWTKEVASIGGSAPNNPVHTATWRELLPEAGEVIFTRTTFELDAVDAVMYRVIAFTRQGYDVYLNGHRIAGQAGRSRTWQARTSYFNENMQQHLRAGTNVIAAKSFLQYFRGKEGNLEIYVEALPAFPVVE